MGLFDRFKKQPQKTIEPLFGETIGSFSDNNPTDNESQEMRAIYSLCKFVGSVMMFTGTRPNEANAMPNFFQFCYTIQSIFPELVMGYCERTGISIYDLYVSPRFESYLDLNVDLNSYLSNCGVIAYQEEYERFGRELTFPDGKMALNLNLPVQFQTMIDTSKMAFVQSLLLFKEVSQTMNTNLAHWLRRYLLPTLLSSSLLLQVNLFHITNQKGLIFIPQSDLDGKTEVNLSFLDPISPNKRLMTYPTILNLMFIENENGNVATGRTNLGGQEGIIMAPTQEAADAIDKVVDNYLLGIVMSPRS